MYIAYASKVSDEHIGSTRLHKDMSGAYNIALDVADAPDGKPGSALWNIWPAWASPLLEKYILDRGLALPQDGNPIHGQKVYLDEGHVKEISALFNIKPFVIHQRKGQAVFIPPGCPHSVR